MFIILSGYPSLYLFISPISPEGGSDMGVLRWEGRFFPGCFQRPVVI